MVVELLEAEPALAQGDRVIVTALQSTEATSFFDWLNSIQTGAPYRFVETAPAVALLQLELNVGSGGRELTETELTELQDHINCGKINHTIADRSIASILQAYGRTLTRSITYRGTVYYQGESKSFCSSSGLLNLAALGMFPGVPVVAYTSINKIKVVH
jgi:hypothetical protein